MRGGDNVFIGLLAVLVLGLTLPAGSPVPVPQPHGEAPPAAPPEKAAPPEVTGSSPADVMAVMRPVLDLLRDSVGLPAYMSTRGLSDEKRLDDLVKEVQRKVQCEPDKPRQARHVDFLLATVPDYVDSNTAWMADEILGAIEAALPHDGYVLDRFYLPEAPEDGASQPRRDGRHHKGDRKRSAEPETTRRPHEIQPGALIFRASCGWQVVLITLETATSGLHVAAFENAARFILRWKERSDSTLGADPKNVYRELRIVGPTFSGSVDFMVASLHRIAETERPQSIRVISGSATANENPAKFRTLCNALNGRKDWKGDCSYASAMHSNWTTVRRLCEFLRGMNPSWVPGRVGILLEYNTSFGQAFDPTRESSPKDLKECGFRPYTFPLHIAQLRSDARAAPEVPLLLTSPATVLKLGERVRPVDLVPPMRTDVASPLTDRSIAAMLDDIRHRGLAAVGIYATDVRDALFLSREVKRAAPDVQLFFPSAHLLYLHPDFVAYTRGAIVASTYPLSAFPQIWGGGDGSGVSPRREVFTSTVAQGVFIATLTQVKGAGALLPDYPYSESPDEDGVGTPQLGRKPLISLSIVGDDGFWPLQQDPYLAGAETSGPLLKQSPHSVTIAGIVLLVIIAAHGVALLLNWSGGCAFVSALTAPAAFEEFGRQHRLMSAIAYVIVGSLGFWMGTVIFVNWFGPASALASAIWLIPVAASTTIVAVSPARVLSPWLALPQVQARPMVKPILAAEWVIGACWLLPIVALVSSVISTYWWREVPEMTARLAAARTIGGGIASPGASTVCLLAVMYVPVMWSLLRLRSLGYGYVTLANRSKAFRHLLGSKETIRSFAALLDVPARHLPRFYFIAIALILSVVTLLLWSNVATVEGMAYTLFLGTASLIGVAAAFALLAQSIEIWRRLRALLLAMADLPLSSALARLGLSHLRWHMSIVAPDTRDLRVPIGLTAELRDRMQDVAALLGRETEAALDEVVRANSRERHGAGVALTQSATWLQLWQLADTLLPALESGRWRRCGDKSGRDVHPPPVAAALDCCETLMATMRALALRDMTSRIMSGIFAAILILGLLVAAHLLYAFQGRASLLTLDVTVLALASLGAVWILIGMEKDAILSLIWRTTPGRVTFNWSLVGRLAVYGVLPLLLVLGSMFPEVGETLVRVIDPLRKLTSL